MFPSIITPCIRRMTERYAFTGVCLSNFGVGIFPSSWLGGNTIQLTDRGYSHPRTGRYLHSSWQGAPTSQVSMGDSPFQDQHGGYPLPRSEKGVPPLWPGKGYPPPLQAWEDGTPVPRPDLGSGQVGILLPVQDCTVGPTCLLSKCTLLSFVFFKTRCVFYYIHRIGEFFALFNILLVLYLNSTRSNSFTYILNRSHWIHNVCTIQQKSFIVLMYETLYKYLIV